MRLRVASVVSFLLLAACGGGGGSDGGGSSTPPPGSGTPAQPVTVAGAVQKGPFLVGSTVLVNKLDALGRATDSTTVAEIKDSVGTFSFSANSAGPVQLVASGYYFSELTGQISSGTLTLKGIYEVGNAASQSAYVNIMTHLINNRVLRLVSGGQLSIGSALTQAQREFVTAFSSTLPVSDPGQFSALSVYNTTGTNDVGNAYLLALSTGFYKYATIKAQQHGTATDAELTLILNQIADDFSDDGQVQKDGFFTEFTAAIRSLSPTEIAANLRRRSVVDYPVGLAVPDISRFLNQCAGTAECAWRSGAPMPLPSRGHATAAFGGKIYVFGGVTPADQSSEPLGNLPATAYRHARVYDPVANTWTPLELMPVGAYDLEAHVVGNKIYVIAGYGVGGFRNELMEYDPLANTWALKTPSPTYRYIFSSAVVNDRIYVIGGQGTIDDGPWEQGKPWAFKSHVAIYDPATDTWSTGQPAPVAFGEADSCVFGDDIYVFGGEDSSGGLLASTLRYNTTTNAWDTRSAMAVAKESFSCVRVGDRFYLLGGWAEGGVVGAVDRYDPVTDTWASPTRLPTPRYWFDAEASAGEIFIMGGANNVTLSLDVVEILNPML